WSLVSAACWSLVNVVLLGWTARNMGWDFGSDALSHAFPVVDGLRSPGYRIPDGVSQIALGLLGFSFTLVGVKYYQTLFAEQAPTVIGWPAGALTVRGAVTEVAMRSWALLPLVLMLPPLLVQPQWWAVCVAIGMILVAASNWAAWSYGRAVLDAA